MSQPAACCLLRWTLAGSEIGSLLVYFVFLRAQRVGCVQFVKVLCAQYKSEAVYCLFCV